MLYSVTNSAPSLTEGQINSAILNLYNKSPQFKTMIDYLLNNNSTGNLSINVTDLGGNQSNSNISLPPYSANPPNITITIDTRSFDGDYYEVPGYPNVYSSFERTLAHEITHAYNYLREYNMVLPIKDFYNTDTAAAEGEDQVMREYTINLFGVDGAEPAVVRTAPHAPPAEFNEPVQLFFVQGPLNFVTPPSSNADDIFRMDYGHHFVDGQGGIDTVDYSGLQRTNGFEPSSIGINVNLSTGKAIAVGFIDDTLLNIENATGGAGNDTLIGNLQNNILDGGNGTDTVNYSATTQGVTVNLATHSATGAEIGTDTLHNIENVTGGSGVDTITGDGKNNRLDGGSSADQLQGGGGADTFVVDAGDTVHDYHLGSEGDTLKFSGGVPQSQRSGNDLVFDNGIRLVNFFDPRNAIDNKFPFYADPGDGSPARYFFPDPGSGKQPDPLPPGGGGTPGPSGTIPPGSTANGTPGGENYLVDPRQSGPIITINNPAGGACDSITFVDTVLAQIKPYQDGIDLVISFLLNPFAPTIPVVRVLGFFAEGAERVMCTAEADDGTMDLSDLLPPLPPYIPPHIYMYTANRAQRWESRRLVA